jgi:hypothetical protein
MGGSVTVNSEQGKGSTFTMNFKCMSLKEGPLLKQEIQYRSKPSKLLHS